MVATLLCAFFAWVMLIITLASIYTTVSKGVKHVTRLHQIPCHNCDFFTNDYRLKCTLHPMIACTEEAIACRDFEFKTDCCNSCQKNPRKALKISSIKPKITLASNLPYLSFNSHLPDETIFKI
jgi:hypothetical protein